MRQTALWLFLLCLFFHLGCSSLPDPSDPDLDVEERTRISTMFLKKGKARFDAIMAVPDHRAEDFEEVLDIWKQGLKYQPENTLILREMVVLLYNMGKAYIQRKQNLLAQAESLKQEGKVKEAKEKEKLAEDAEQKALDCFRRVIFRLNLLLQHRKPHSPAEEKLFFLYYVTSYIYLGQFRQALAIVDERLREIPDDSPQMEQLMEMRETIVEAMRQVELKKME